MRCSSSRTVIAVLSSLSLLTTVLPLLHSTGVSSLLSLQFMTKSCTHSASLHIPWALQEAVEQLN